MNGDADSIQQDVRQARLPGVGQPGSTDTTDIANLNIARSMERADIGGRFGFGSPQYRNARTPTDELIEGAVQGREATGPQPTMQQQNERGMQNSVLDGISQRRDSLEVYRRQIMAKLGIIPPGEAGYSAVVLASGQARGRRGEIPSDREMLLENLSVLNKESDDLLREHHYAASEFARRSHENFALEKDILSSRDFAGLAHDLNAVHSDPRLKIGTTEYEEAVFRAVEAHPHGSRTAAGEFLLKQIAGDHDKTAAIEDRSYWQRFGQSFKETSQVARKLGVDPQYDEQGFPSISETRKQAGKTGVLGDVPQKEADAHQKLQGEIQAHLDASKKEEARNIKAKKANEPYSKSKELEKAQFKKTALENAFPSLKTDATTTTTTSTAIKHLGTYNPETGEIE